MSDKNLKKMAEGNHPDRGNNNPWQVLVLAAMFFIPGLIMVLSSEEAVVSAGLINKYGPNTGLAKKVIVSQGTVHGFGVAALVIAGLIIIFYFHVRRAIREDPVEENE